MLTEPSPRLLTRCGVAIGLASRRIITRRQVQNGFALDIAFARVAALSPFSTPEAVTYDQ
jgi:hypothetical protein